MTATPLPTITEEQIAEIEELANKREESLYIHGLANGSVLALISRLRAAERDAALLKLYSPIIDEVERRAEKECCLQDRCDFTVTVSYDDYAAIDQAMKGEQQ